MKKTGYLALVFLLGMGTLVGCSSGEEESNEVVIFSSMEDFRNEALEQQLEEQLPDIDVVVQQYATGNNAAKLKSEGIDTEADIVLGVETALFSDIIDNFASLSEFSSEQYLDEFMYDDRMRIWEKSDGAVIVNTDVLKEKGLPIPTCYEDLADEKYKDLIVMPSPKTSNTGYMFLNTWVNTMGEEKAFNYIDEMQKNIKQFTESGSGPVKALVQGEVAIGLGMAFQAAREITEGAPLQILEFEEGNPYNTTSFGIIKGREEDEAVREVFNFLNEEFIGYDKAYFVPGQVLKEQTSYIDNYPEYIKSSDMSTITDAKLKETLLAKWKY